MLFGFVLQIVDIFDRSSFAISLSSRRYKAKHSLLLFLSNYISHLLKYLLRFRLSVRRDVGELFMLLNKNADISSFDFIINFYWQFLNLSVRLCCLLIYLILLKFLEF